MRYICGKRATSLRVSCSINVIIAISSQVGNLHAAFCSLPNATPQLCVVGGGEVQPITYLEVLCSQLPPCNMMFVACHGSSVHFGVGGKGTEELEWLVWANRTWHRIRQLRAVSRVGAPAACGQQLRSIHEARQLGRDVLYTIHSLWAVRAAERLTTNARGARGENFQRADAVTGLRSLKAPSAMPGYSHISASKGCRRCVGAATPRRRQTRLRSATQSELICAADVFRDLPA